MTILDLNAALDTMISRNVDGQWECAHCGKVFKTKQMVKRHAEVHMAVTHQCIACYKVFKTRNALSTHYTRYHPDVESPWNHVME